VKLHCLATRYRWLAWREAVSLAVAVEIEKTLGPFPGPSATTAPA
jgi:hypothetical protein